jgi:hypothetical protein
VDAFREEIEKLRHRRPRSAEELQLGLWSGAEAPQAPAAVPGGSPGKK